MTRVLHISDVHVDVPFGALPKRALLNKRIVGAANQWLRRGRRFRFTRDKLRALARFAEESDVDAVICTGDYTVVGTDPELAAARAAIEPLTRAPLGFATVPGNHDLYLDDGRGDFALHFGDLLEGELGEHRVDGPWPAVRFFGDHVAVVAVSSARPNPQVWRSSGRIPDVQLDALRNVLADSRLTGRFVFVITHYAPRLADGRPDHFSHGLLNADAFLRASAPASAILHGHVHRCFHVRIRGAPPLFGAGSTTEDGVEGLWLFDIEPGEAIARRGRFDSGRYLLREEPSVRVSWSM